MCKTDPVCCKFVNIGCFVEGPRVVGSDIHVTQIVHEEEKYVRLSGRGRQRAEAAAKHQAQRGPGDP